MKPLVCIFAHPDDEALGPGGTIATFAKERDVYIICVTSGEAEGKTAEEKDKIGAVRRGEIQTSATILGVKEVFFLEYEDGTLCNNLYHDIAEKTKAKLEELQPDALMTFEQRGVSGHIDHITVSMITSFLFEKLSFIKTVYYHCVCKEQKELMKDYFIYFPHGYDASEVDKVIDVSDVWETKVRAIHAHRSQMHDVEMVLGMLNKFTKEEYFFVVEK